MASRNLDKILLFSTDFVDSIIAASQIFVAKRFARKYFTRIEVFLKPEFKHLSQISAYLIREVLSLQVSPLPTHSPGLTGFLINWS